MSRVLAVRRDCGFMLTTITICKHNTAHSAVLHALCRSLLAPRTVLVADEIGDLHGPFGVGTIEFPAGNVETSKTMPTITFDVPEGALSALRLSPIKFVKEMRVAAALLWYSHGELSQSKAAEIASTSRAEFIDELAHRRIPVVQVTAEELRDEIHRE